MSRSSKKGPYIDQNLSKKVAKQKAGDGAIKTWARSSQIPPEFIAYTFLVHNGKKFIEVYITEDMVGHRLGEFAPTRTFRGHGRVVKRTLEKT
ncbi:30S ribosomal protein S19 [Patescibacteria group bacterium]|nr:30S ribosomal protein S19 [Patescibacteria group bacterium]MCG2702449.1 30S ribosomal protein S19 [Candidatus Parcubacteria bacterium]MBU4210311.1 30S ribosomal protein S19 [Patescibacteria group bacterium]MBU4264501.1 30S ribosomal protein S19 [Patescibacteria group bacterium]MBU4390432.1 30S ribosomal protein S19 [Patescibacteria group bacterium]